VTDENKLRIHWSLGNTCNLNCSYCPDELKDGTSPFPPIARLRPAFANILEQARAFSRIDIDMPGGEPTQSFALRELMLENSNPEVHFKLHSNAQADTEWWASVAHKIYELDLTYHITTDLTHFMRVLDIVKDKCILNVIVPHTPDNWRTAQHAYKYIKGFVGSSRIRMLYANFTRGNNQYLDYSQDQWDTYYRSIGVDPTKPKEVETTIEFKRVNNLNNFFGSLCYAGVNQIIIDNFGYVYRGWCKANDHMGNIYDGTFKLDPSPRPCPKQQCTNGFDLQAHKSKKSWGMV
jgi:sulfatase maturation enzyme AslB (radical SAM superfamily)